MDARTRLIVAINAAELANYTHFAAALRTLYKQLFQK